ncbi:hypothetical protein [Naasia sp. SYSU D00057]|uniref:hypothetical protein n=1 Tax=Naasia sp. SYSU D00057 TaxID=2817380 RepID=UPI001B307E57|nr:hypothetical protein [Naasia sp. SYSU D00057]
MSGNNDEATDSEGAADRLLADVGIHDIGQRLIDLGEQLVAIGRHTDSAKLREHISTADEVGVDAVWDEVDREMTTAIRRTLSGLGAFRKEYANWERLTVEYALSRRNFTQRDVAQLLGVGLTTVNRWAQHPLTHDQD